MIEFWSGEAVNDLLKGVGVDPSTVIYRVKREDWDMNGPDDVRHIIEIMDVRLR